MERIYKRFMQCIGMACAIMFFVMFAVSFLQVFFRYIMNDSLIWSEELARYLFVWISFLGGAVVMERGSHIRIDILESCIRGMPKKAILRVAKALSLAFLAALATSGFMIVGLTMDQPSAVMQIPMGLVYLAIPIGSLAMMIVLAKNFFRGETAGAGEVR